MKLKMYGYPKCGTCRDALKWLQGKGHDVDMHDLFEQAPPVSVLQDLVERSGLDVQKFFNTSGEVYKEMQLKDKVKQMPFDEKLALLASNGRLIKRPIVDDGTKVTVGFKAADYENVWSR
ncbi:arsenate reductase family protein [Paenibacillus contaminans]|uniref:Arsenate reductase family protein n=1 Tax=Paenibacillus contaminans TaxID=450362 RepID=A0A329M054_9BACL|nr:arsenate reductase family protein [Paenibacillus contaminans]RAV12942.1 arsenate reductase family protein [Paenibacillus contaminans]